MIERIAAHVDDKGVLATICKEAKQRAKADRGAKRGTAIHRLTDRLDAGETLIQTRLAEAIEAVWPNLWESAGIEVIPEYMERIVVYPHRRLCGKLDRIARRKSDGSLVIVDTKSGKWELDFPHGAAVQLALYAHAPMLAGPLNGRGETDQFEPMPDVDKEHALIVHLPEEGQARVAEIDIAAAWQEGALAASRCLKWRSHPKQSLVRILGRVEPIPAWTPPDEGGEVTDFELQRLRDDFKRSSGKAQVDVWLKESIDAGRSFHPTPPHGIPSERRTAIIRAAIQWSELDPDVVRAGLSSVLGDEVQPTVTIGSVLGSLSIAEAQQFAALESAMSLRFRDDGTPVVVPA